MFSVGEKVFVEYGVESYVEGIVKVLNDNKIGVQCNGYLITTTINCVYNEKPKNLKHYHLKNNDVI